MSRFELLHKTINIPFIQYSFRITRMSRILPQFIFIKKSKSMPIYYDFIIIFSIFRIAFAFWCKVTKKDRLNFYQYR